MRGETPSRVGAAEVPAGRGRGKAEAIGVGLVDDRRADDAALDDRDAAFRQSFEVERKGEEVGIERIIGEREVGAEDLLAEVADEERGAVFVA